ncbi:MAG: hypothetical protein LBI85_02615 [Spirochaetaceae bacterium]|jgi:hypothetical protein|nr:hypothetical protein [Spirochaetaceae bacterium]
MDDELEIIFNETAFKHGVTEADIRWAFKTFKYDQLVEGEENKYLLLGFNIQGNLIEVIYKEINDHRVNVFHAMPCRNVLFPLLGT